MYRWDGVRAVVVHGAGGTRLYPRNQKPMTTTYPELARALDAQTPEGLVADGEVVAFDGEQTSSPGCRPGSVELARAIADRMPADAPDELTTEQRVAKREGRIFLDTNRLE
jgi:hypothetical protein